MVPKDVLRKDNLFFIDNLLIFERPTELLAGFFMS